MKICTKCKKNLPINQFRKKLNSTTAQCKDCLKQYFKNEYITNSNRKVTITKATRLRRKKLSEFLTELKSKPCMDCHNCYPSYVMDFDHRNNKEKILNIATVTQRGWSKEKILTEVAKCDLVCANCHRIRTFKRASSLK